MLGLARHAQMAGWGTIPPSFVATGTAAMNTSSGFERYYWPIAGTGADNGLGMSYQGPWNYDGTSASTSIGHFTAQHLYIPLTALTNAAENDTINIWSKQLSFDSSQSQSIYGNFILNRTVNGSSQPHYQFQVNIDNYFPIQSTWNDYSHGFQASWYDRWIVILQSTYHTTANYTSWSSMNTISGYDVYRYHRIVVADPLTGELLAKYDATEGLLNDWIGNKLYWKGYAAYTNNINNASYTTPSIDTAICTTGMWGDPSVGVGIATNGYWFAFGSTLDPLQEYQNYAGSGVYTTSERPYWYIPTLNASDWVDADPYWQPTVTANSRFQPNSGEFGPLLTRGSQTYAAAPIII